jgi:UTP--glucose-1-phosphate uridylyltransferase
LYETLRERGKTAELDIVKAAEIEAGRLAVFRQHRPLGLGHAVWCARHFVGDEPFAVILPDDVIQSDRPCLAQMTENYQAAGGGILVAVEEVPREHVNRYGILDIDGTVGKLTKVKGLVEKPKPEDAPSNLSIIGRYILPPNIFTELERHERGAGGEIQLTDAMARLIGKVPVHGYSFEGKRFDCGNKVGFIAATLSFALKRPDLSSAVREAIAGIL